MLARIQVMSWMPDPHPVMIMNLSLPSRVTVRSHLIPPLWLSILVYVMRPTGWSIRLDVMCSRDSRAVPPVTSILVNGVRSNIATRDLAPRCSAPATGDQYFDSQPRRSAASPAISSSKASLAWCH